MKIALAQLNPTVGDFKGNADLIQKAYARAVKCGARFLLTPELSICGYPPHDLLERPEIVERCEAILKKLAKLTEGQTCALIVGHVAPSSSAVGRPVQNQLTVLEQGRAVFTQAKTLLPTYDVFDEARYFEPATQIRLWECEGKKIALAICEDLWSEDQKFGKKLYSTRPIQAYREQGADVICVVSASPYEWGKRTHREQLHLEHARDLGIPLIYVNQVGGTDEILFDGASFVASGSAGASHLIARLPVFRESFGLVDWTTGGPERSSKLEMIEPTPSQREDTAPPELQALHRGIVVGLKDYFRKTGFRKAVIGLSGGIDSAVVATLAVEALGAPNLIAVAMPSQFSSSHSLEDAEALAKNLGIRLETKPIKFAFVSLNRELAEGRGSLKSIAQENLQARLRGVFLMTLANHEGALVLTTGNKSELAMGYCTLYGDMVGALAPIGDLFKTRVYELAHLINQTWIGQNPRAVAPIPERSISKPPSAELKPDQKDEDSLPPYDALDPVLQAYLEESRSVESIRHEFKHPWIDEIFKKLEINEYKRRQAAPVLKLSAKAFGLGRRIPIAKIWDKVILKS